MSNLSSYNQKVKQHIDSILEKYEPGFNIDHQDDEFDEKYNNVNENKVNTPVLFSHCENKIDCEQTKFVQQPVVKQQSKYIIDIKTIAALEAFVRNFSEEEYYKFCVEPGSELYNIKVSLYKKMNG